MARITLPALGPLRRPLRFLRNQLPPLNFITLHYGYFIATCLATALIFWGSSTPFQSVSFTDSLFLTISAMSEAGLNTVNLSTLNTFQQFLLFLLIMLGSAIWVSGFIVQVRRKAFETRFEVIAKQKAERARSRSRGRRARTWNSSRRSTDLQRNDEEAAREKEKDKENVKPESNSSATASDEKDAEESRQAMDQLDHDSNFERQLTPPARRGGPEMNALGTTAFSDSEEETPHSAAPGITFRGDTRFPPSTQSAGPPQAPRQRGGSAFFTMQGVGARPGSSRDFASPTRAGPGVSFERAYTLRHEKSEGEIGKHFHSAGGWIARNSQFHGLTAQEREKLGGCEYRAVSLLAWLVPLYFVLWQLLGCLGCAAWVAYNASDAARQNGLNPWWVGAFNAVSAFNNSGMSLLDANMTAFQSSDYMLITMSLLILAGNTCYPVFLRWIVWALLQGAAYMRTTRTNSAVWVEFWDEQARTLQFLLDHPRRCYTNMFPAQHTWWLLLSVITLNGIDWAAFEILNIDNAALNSGLPTNVRVIDGLFQAFAVRSGGFYVVPIPTLRVSLQVLYVVMMYISVYPVVITMRNSNVYEERSLGIYAEDQPDADDKDASSKKPQTSDPAPGILRRAMTLGNHLVAGGAPAGESNGHFVRQQLRAQLAHDTWCLVLALFLIMIIENQQFVDQPAVFSVFNFIFEIVSAYGCVGISVGVPWAAYSFSGSWHTLSKLILCAVMLRGRHRGLPVAIDKAVLLPGEEHARAEEEDGRIRMARTMSRGRDGFV